MAPDSCLLLSLSSFSIIGSWKGKDPRQPPLLDLCHMSRPGPVLIFRSQPWMGSGKNAGDTQRLLRLLSEVQNCMVGAFQGHRDGVAHLSPREVSTLGGSERQVHAWWGCSVFV